MIRRSWPGSLPTNLARCGPPRDAQSVSPATTTEIRDKYYLQLLSYVGAPATPRVAGANFWSFGGTSRPIPGQLFWKAGDELMGDPPMEEQGLNSVFDGDS